MAESGKLAEWQVNNAWREIITRIFEEVETEFNIWPEWLVNPATNRPLKLDLHYPQLGVAVRFEGVQGKRKLRLSLEEEAQQAVRERARQELCRANGVELIVVDLAADDPPALLREVDVCLSRAKERVTSKKAKAQIKQARAVAAELARRVKQVRGLRLYADLWNDRQHRLAEPQQSTSSRPPVNMQFEEEMLVEHPAFGQGIILTVTDKGDDIFLRVDFVMAGVKVLAASLVADKLRVKSK